MTRLDTGRTGASRWFRAVARLFPQQEREGRVPEMLDALEVNAGSSVVRETASLVWAACVAWRRYSFSREIMQQAAFAGALLWFGLLISLGPLIRLNGAIREGGTLQPAGYSTNAALYVASALSLIAALVLLASHRRWISRTSMWVLFPVGLIAAAATNRVGQFQLFRSLVYEMRWLGLAFALAVLLRPTTPWRWPAAAALVPTALLVFAPPMHRYQFDFGINYGRLLQIGFDGYLGRSNLVDLVVGLSIVGVIVAPFFFPAVAAFFTVPVLGVMIAPTARVGPAEMLSTTVAFALYLALVALWNYRRPKLRVSIDRSQQPGNRFDLSVEFTSNKSRW